LYGSLVYAGSWPAGQSWDEDYYQPLNDLRTIESGVSCETFGSSPSQTVSDFDTLFAPEDPPTFGGYSVLESQNNVSSGFIPWFTNSGGQVEGYYGPDGQLAFYYGGRPSLEDALVNDQFAPDVDGESAVGFMGRGGPAGWSAQDIVSRMAPPSPTEVLTALAAAGRNPADITLPTVGTEASGEEDDVVAAGGSGASGSTPSGASLSGSGSDTTENHDNPTFGAEKNASTTVATASGGLAPANSVASASAASTSASAPSSTSSLKPEDDGGGATASGSHESPVGAFFYNLFVVQGGQAVTALSEGLYAVATSPEARQSFGQTWQSSRVKPLADRLVGKAELRGTMNEIADTNDPRLAYYVFEDMIGANAVEAAYGVDLTAKELEGGLFDGGERTQYLLNGGSAFLGSAAFGLGMVSEATGLTFKIGPAKPAPPNAGGSAVPPVEGSNARVRSANPVAAPVTRPISELREAGLKDAHHVIQDAAVRDLPGYSTQVAPGVQLPGPSTARGTPHYSATQVQRQPGGGTYAAERRIGYKALRRGGLCEAEARQAIQEADGYFSAIGVGPGTSTRIPGNR
jgi:hypothetical protein